MDLAKLYRAQREDTFLPTRERNRQLVEAAEEERKIHIRWNSNVMETIPDPIVLNVRGNRAVNPNRHVFVPLLEEATRRSQRAVNLYWKSIKIEHNALAADQY